MSTKLTFFLGMLLFAVIVVGCMVYSYDATCGHLPAPFLYYRSILTVLLHGTC